jgi:hypothetical protein
MTFDKMVHSVESLAYIKRLPTRNVVSIAHVEAQVGSATDQQSVAPPQINEKFKCLLNLL